MMRKCVSEGHRKKISYIYIAGEVEVGWGMIKLFPPSSTKRYVTSSSSAIPNPLFLFSLGGISIFAAYPGSFIQHFSSSQGDNPM